MKVYYNYPNKYLLIESVNNKKKRSFEKKWTTTATTTTTTTNKTNKTNTTINTRKTNEEPTTNLIKQRRATAFPNGKHCAREIAPVGVRKAGGQHIPSWWLLIYLIFVIIERRIPCASSPVRQHGGQGTPRRVQPIIHVLPWWQGSFLETLCLFLVVASTHARGREARSLDSWPCARCRAGGCFIAFLRLVRVGLLSRWMRACVLHAQPVLGLLLPARILDAVGAQRSSVESDSHLSHVRQCHHYCAHFARWNRHCQSLPVEVIVQWQQRTHRKRLTILPVPMTICFDCFTRFACFASSTTSTSTSSIALAISPCHWLPSKPPGYTC